MVLNSYHETKGKSEVYVCAGTRKRNGSYEKITVYAGIEDPSIQLTCPRPNSLKSSWTK